MSELHTLTACELVDAFRKRTLSPVEVTAAVLKRIEAFNPVFNAFNLVSDRAMDEHVRLERNEINPPHLISRIGD
jgi:Asp-tRNA(Asn)/Glu-tRNA(Gln) amidotransferase A subunit family amidase